LQDGSHWARLVMAKTRLAPLKKITIVRLALNADFLAKRQLRKKADLSLSAFTSLLIPKL